MSTGISSVANLAEMAAVYPFAGYEWAFALILLAFTAYFIASQIGMDREESLEASATPISATPATTLAPAE